MSVTQRKSLAVICLVASLVASVSASVATEAQTNNVELTIYQMSVSQWNTALASFKTEVAAQAATYCTANYDTCGLDSSSTVTFVSSYVGIFSQPEMDSKSLKVSIYLEFDSLKTLKANPPTQDVVNSAALKAILEGSITSLETVLNHDITYVGETFYSIEPAKQANEVIIPVAFVILLAIVCLTIGLHMWKKRQEAEERKKLKSEKRTKKTGRVRPLHGVENETKNKQASNFWPRRFRKKKTVKVRMESVDEEQQQQHRPRRANGHIPTLSLKTNMEVADTKSPGAMEKMHYEERVHVRNDALPPLPSLDQKCTSEDEQEKRDKKEKKRRKKEKRRQEMQESGVESESDRSKSESHGHNVVPVEA